MGYPNRDYKPNNRDGGRDYNGKNYNSGPSRRPELHHAVCSNCGKDCEVPFRPSGEKPVFCRECFAKNRNHDSRDNREAPRQNYQQFNQSPTPALTPRNKELDTINSKLDQILELLKTNNIVVSAPEETLVIEEKIEETPKPKKKRVSKKATAVKE